MFFRRNQLPFLLASLLPIFGCSSSSDDPVFIIQTTSQAVAATSPVVVRGEWLVYLASESMTNDPMTTLGTMLNPGDTDTSDNVAFAVNMASGSSDNVGVAAFAAEIVGAEIYLAVRESDDNVDWDGSGIPLISDFSLLHWSLVNNVVTFVDSLDITSVNDLAFVQTGDRLYYSRTDATAMTDESTVRYVDATTPTMSTAVFNEMGMGANDPTIVYEDSGLVFLSLDETVDGADHNGDTDMTDTSVLALLDGTDPSATIQNTQMATPAASGPFDAFFVAANDWTVAFLVDENAQGMTNLNNPADFTNPLLPASCAMPADMDAVDDILFFVDFADFSAGMTSPVSTGIPGNDRVLAYDDFVATLSDEGPCDLNEDGDITDTMVRWAGTALPVLPSRNPTNMRAVATNLPGGAMGVATLGGVIVAAVDEAMDSEDINLRGGMVDDLLGIVNPDDGISAVWDFQHQAPAPFVTVGTAIFDNTGASEPFAGASWMAEESVSGRLGIAFQERVPTANPNITSLNTNFNCIAVQKDLDGLDSLPIWADLPFISGHGPVLDFDGVGYAIDASDLGMVIARGFAFFRVDEAADNRDYNADNVANDFVLFRNPLTACGPVPMGTSSNIDGPVIFTDGERAAAFLSSESMAGLDFNGDGDTNDLVIRHFLM